MISAQQLADYIVGLQDPEVSDLTHLKLQKLLYYCYGHVLAKHGERLFDEPFLAWQHGPVLKSVYDAYKEHGRQVLPVTAKPPAMNLPDPILRTIHEVIGDYGQYSAWCLREMTHNELPWQTAFNDASYNEIISDADINSHFSQVIRGA